MKASIVILCVFTILCCKYIETYKVIQNKENNATVNQYLDKSTTIKPQYKNIVIHSKVINNEIVLTENDNKNQVFGNNRNLSARSGGEYSSNIVLNSNTVNDDENTEAGSKQLSHIRLHRRKSKDIDRNEARDGKISLKNDRPAKAILQMSSLSVDECSSGKERADDGTCVSIEIAIDSDEIIDVLIIARGNDTEVETMEVEED